MNRNLMVLIFILYFSNLCFALKTETTAELEINISNTYDEQYLSVFYVLGHTVISFSDEQIHISEIKTTFDSFKIQNNNKLEVPSTNISVEGFSHAFNYLVLVIHPRDSFTWKNADGSFPKNTVEGNNNEFTKVVFLSKAQINKMKKEEKDSSRIKININ